MDPDVSFLLRNNLFDKITSPSLNELKIDEYEKEIFEYLGSIDSQKYYESLSKYSKKLDNIKSENFN